MWSLSGAARQALAQSHTMNAKIVVLHDGKPVYSLVPYSGTVNAAAGRSVMRNLGCTVVDPTGRLSGGDIEDLLSPYDCEVQPWRAVRTPAGYEWVPQGVFGLTARNAVGTGEVQLTGQDRAMIYQGGMTGQVGVSAGTAIENAIESLLRTRNPRLHWQSWATGYTVGPLLYQADIDVWGEAQKLAASVGGWLWHDREGLLHFSPLAPLSNIAVAVYRDGDGLLLAANRQEDSDTIHNVVVVQNTNQQGTGVSGGTVITSIAQDNDPTSPTYAFGKYGRRVKVITNQTVTTQQQADQAAAIALISELGRAETVSIDVITHPGIDPLDVAVVHRPLVGLVHRALVIQEVDMPLTAKDKMGIHFRKYLLAENGQTIDTVLTVNS